MGAEEASHNEHNDWHVGLEHLSKRHAEIQERCVPQGEPSRPQCSHGEADSDACGPGDILFGDALTLDSYEADH